MNLTPSTRRILTLNPRVFVSGSRVYRRNISTTTKPDDTRTRTSSAEEKVHPEKGKKPTTPEEPKRKRMRLPYVTDPPPAATPEEQAIVDAVRARRAPRPLQPLDLTLLVSFSPFCLEFVSPGSGSVLGVGNEVVWLGHGLGTRCGGRSEGCWCSLCNWRWREGRSCLFSCKGGSHTTQPSHHPLSFPHSIPPSPPPHPHLNKNNKLTPPPQHSPPVTLGWNHFLSAIRTQTSLAPDLRELAICRVAIVNRAWYEWMHHAPLASAAGVSAAGMEACKDPSPLVLENGPPEGSGLTETQWVVLCYADEMTRNVEVREGTAGRVRGEFGERGTVEVTATVSFFLVSLYFFRSSFGAWGGVGGWEEGGGVVW